MKRFIKEYLLENRTLKLTAILLSLILWLFVRGESGQERVLHGVPLEIQVPRHMEITSERIPSVEVTMVGMWLSQQIVPATCMIDLSKESEGKHVVSLKPENVKIPKGFGIEVTKIEPSQVTLMLERTISREVPIVVPVRGEPGKGFEIYGRSSRPTAVVITGPRSHVEAVRDVPTEVVSITGQKQPIRSFVALNVKDNTIRTALTNPVQVDIQIGPKRRVFTIGHIPIAIDDPGFVTSPATIAVQVLAPLDSDLAPADFTAFVSIKNIDVSALPALTKPLVRLVSTRFNGAAILKDVFPSEVLVKKTKPSTSAPKARGKK